MIRGGCKITKSLGGGTERASVERRALTSVVIVDIPETTPLKV